MPYNWSGSMPINAINISYFLDNLYIIGLIF